MNVTSRRIVVALGLALAAVAISVPVAQGARPDDRAVHGVGAITTPTAVPDAIERAVRIHTDSLNAVPDAFERAALRAQPTQAVRPDDRTGVRGPGIVASSPILSASTGSDATLRNDAAHYGRQSTPQTPSPIVLNDTVHNRNQEAAAQQSPSAIVVRVEGGFDWISAAVGAAGGCGLLLVLGVATAALRRRERIDAAQA